MSAWLIRGLTLHRPWPWAIVHGGKDVENRTWRPPTWMIGAHVALHVGLEIQREAIPDVLFRGRIRTPALHVGELLAHPGHVVAVARIAGVVERSASPWFFGPYGWQLVDVVELPRPVRCVGSRRLWVIPGPQQQDIEVQWRSAA